MQISIVYFSVSGYTDTTAKQIAKGIEAVSSSIKVNLYNIKDTAVDLDALKASSAVIFGSPTYMGNVCSDIMKWIETKDNCACLNGKLGASFATAKFQQGGADVAIGVINNFMLVAGMLVYSGGTTQKPFTHFGAVALNDCPDVNAPQAKGFGERIAKKAMELFD